MASKKTNQLPAAEPEALLQILKERFDKNVHRHKNISWAAVSKKLEARPKMLWTLNEMERTNGEPDVVDFDEAANEYIFFDCSKESPLGRRSICYDPEALASRKEHKPQHSAIGMAKEMGVEILTEKQYKYLQQLGDFDLKTSSWVLTPANIRKLGGAIFCDKRYATVFLYHNGAESYYGSRGFRAALKV